MDRTALIVVDVQRGFDDAGFWGPRNNTACEENVRALIAAWRGSNQPIVFVRHHWDEDGSPLRSDEAGSDVGAVTGPPPPATAAAAPCSHEPTDAGVERVEARRRAATPQSPASTSPAPASASQGGPLVVTRTSPVGARRRACGGP